MPPIPCSLFGVEHKLCLLTKMPLSKSVTHRKSVSGILNRYTKLAVGGVATATCASFESAEAALIFTAPNIFLDHESDPIEGRVDFDANGVAEVGVVVGLASAPDANGNVGIVLGGGLFGADIAFSGRYPVAFHASDFVTEALDFRTAIGTMAMSSAGLLGSRGNWFSGMDAYLGARFVIEGDNFYGWVHAVWDPSINTMMIDLAAYEDTGGAARIIPQPKEPENYSITFGSKTDLSAGRIELSWPMLAGKTYELQRTKDLQTWNTIHVITPYIDREEVYLDQSDGDDPEVPRCFYRVKQNEMSLMLLALGVPRRKRKAERSAD